LPLHVLGKAMVIHWCEGSDEAVRSQQELSAKA